MAEPIFYQSNENNNDSSLENRNYISSKASHLCIDCSRKIELMGTDLDTEADSGRPSSVDTDPRSPGASTAAPVANASDQKKSCHLHATPIPGDENDVIHQFLIPNRLGGSMVGTRGRNINYIRAKSGASVWISRNFFDTKTQVVNVRGPLECVKCALQVIKKRFPELDVKPINTVVPIQRNPALQPTMCQLSLPIGMFVDVHVSAACRGITLFAQQPCHPTFHQLEEMDSAVRRHYADQPGAPPLPRPVNPGAVCVAPSAGGVAWHRAIIADVFPESDSVLMKFLDWGGYQLMPVGSLKQIRTEMMHLPFQAVECHLAYVTPLVRPDLEVDEQLEALSGLIMRQFLQGRRLKLQVVYYNQLGQPCVYVYSQQPGGQGWRCLQDELVESGLAQWFLMHRLAPQLPPATM